MIIADIMIKAGVIYEMSTPFTEMVFLKLTSLDHQGTPILD